MGGSCARSLAQPACAVTTQNRPPILPCLSDDLASKANIVIDPLELQAATMDDLDEDDEPAPTAAQVWQQGRAEVSRGLFLHLVGRGMTQVQLLSMYTRTFSPGKLPGYRWRHDPPCPCPVPQPCASRVLRRP